MEQVTLTSTVMKGAGWLNVAQDPSQVFTPEDCNKEELMMMEMCHQFLEKEVSPLFERIDHQEPGLLQSIMEKAAEAGLMGISIPEQFGGLGKSFLYSVLAAEALGGGHSFSVATATHSGMGTLPILYFGTEAQQKKYIPSLVSGESKGAYGLTEPNCGSDTMGIKTSAVLSSDGKHYLLNGQKSWITNGGIADVYTIFAKVDGSQFTAFIVERGMVGFTQGTEEHKMGIRGTSTVQLYFQDCKVPVENVLGEIGKGHHIALNILNTSRLKLCAANVGGAKKYLEKTVKYARSRELFKAPIANLGSIRHKLGEMATRTWVVESALYRATSLIDEKEKELLAKGHPFNEAQLGAAEEYAIESTILKVAGSELIDFVVDEGVQVHGANGYNEAYHIARAYRDSRVNRILEGTNEINRLLTVDMVFKRAMKGRLDMMGPAMAVQKELMSIPDFGASDDSLFAAELKAIQQFKKAIFLVAGAAVQKLMMKIESEQEILMHISDMAIDIYLAESALLRTIKLADMRGEEGVARELDMTRICIYDVADRIAKNGKDAINAFASGDEQRMMLLGIKRFTKVTPFNTKDARRRIADGL